MNTLTIDPFPYGKRFAVTIVDDTDGATTEKIKPVYKCLDANNIHITKTVWPLKASSPSGNGTKIDEESDTLEQNEYRTFCQYLHSRGFEIAMHTASSGNSIRAETIKAYDYFEKIFGHPPFTNVMHSRNKENIYWGKHCIQNPILSKFISILEPQEFLGHVRGSEYYWGDICRERTKYVRMFETLGTDTLNFDPDMPYHDEFKPDVRWWFSSSYGAGTRIFSLLSENNIQNLRNNGGISIVHAYCRHYSKLNSDNKYVIHEKFKDLIENLSAQEDGYYAPVYRILDRIRAIRNLKVNILNGNILIENNSEITLKDLAVKFPNNSTFLKNQENLGAVRNNYNQIKIGTLKMKENMTLKTDANIKYIKKPFSTERISDLHYLYGYTSRLAWQFLHGRRRMTGCEDPPWVSTLWT